MDSVLIGTKSAAASAAHFCPSTWPDRLARMHQSPETQTTFGYLSAIESPDHGFFGGYLVVSPLGRPLEFHCTAPVLPNRAQRILYGATLESYLLGEQIGGSLLSAGKLAPALFLTDHAAFGLLRQRFTVPLVLVGPTNTQPDIDVSAGVLDEPTSASKDRGCSAGTAHASWGTGFILGGCVVQLPVGFESERGTVIKLVEMLRVRVDLLEPFARIHEAIREAQRIGTRSGVSHGHAA